MHSIILLYNFIASYLDVYSFGCMPSKYVFIYFPSSCLKFKYITVYHNRVILMHTVLLIRFTSYWKSPLYLICIYSYWNLNWCVFAYTDYMQKYFSLTLFGWFDCNPLLVIIYSHRWCMLNHKKSNRWHYRKCKIGIEPRRFHRH